MRGLKTWACAVVVVATAAPAIAQQTGGGGTGTTGRTGTTTGTGGITSGGTTTSGGTSMSGGGSGATTSDGTGAGLPAQVEAPPVITALTGSTGSSTDPVLGKFYGNPYYQGRDHTLTNVAPGGFGAALYPAGATGRTGAGASTTANRTGTSANGRTSSTNMSGILIPLPVQINYAAEVRFASPPVAAPKLQGDLQTVVGTGGLANSKAVQVVVDGNNNVILRGTVMDDEEARLVEGLVRLTPGVRNISNELTFPVASK